ncbi:MAG: CDP-glycerol glycerophosphotransferase family protein [Nocardioidaceae bacterium]|nr:CDP-glycerol glycerophosphotransferase family protein [Nocardioidaceae bacterium]
MSPADSVGRRIARRITRVTRRAAPTVAAGASGPRLSVVVDVREADEPFLGECVASVLAQKPRLEVLLVLRAGAAAAHAAAERLAADDPRVRVVEAAAVDEVASRAAGVAEVAGDLLVFLRGCDTVPAGSYAPMVKVLDDGGVDLALGRTRTRRGRPDPSLLDPTPTPRTDVEACPSALTDPHLGGRMTRRALWDSLGEEPGGGAEPQGMERALLAVLAARSFAVVDRVVNEVHERAAGAPIGTIRPLTPSVGDVVEALARLDAVVRERRPALVDAWSQAVLTCHLLRYVEDAERFDADSWRTVRDAVRTFRARLDGPPAVRSFETAVVLALAEADRQPELAAFVASRWYEVPHVDTVVSGASVHARVPQADLPVDPALLELPEAQTPLTLSLRSARWDDDVLELVVWAAVRRVEQTDDVTAQVRLVGTGGPRPVDVVVRDDVAVSRWAGDRYQSHDRGVLVVRVGADDLEALDDEALIEVTLQVGGVVRTATVAAADRFGALAPGARGTLGRKHWLRDRPRPALVARHVRASAIEIAVDGRKVSGIASAPVVAVRGKEQVEATSSDAAFVLDLPAVASTAETPPRWELHGRGEDGALVPLDADRCDVLGDSGLHATARGAVVVDDLGGRWQVTAVRVEGEVLELGGRWCGEALEASVRLAGPVVAEGVLGDGHASLPLTASRGGGPELPLPSGSYRVEVTVGGRALPAVWADDVRSRAGERVDTESLRIDLRQGGGPWLVLAVGPRVGDDEVGPRAQEVLRHRAASAPVVLEDAVYLQSYDGRAAVDSPLALHTELRRRDEGHVLFWGVRDLSTPLPEGGVPLVIGSREWHRVVAGARHLVSNVDFDRRVRMLPHQRFLQTFHGYPSKAMGLGLWRAKGFTPRRIEAERRRTVEEWTAILTPTPEMDLHYREQYGYDGPILDRGLPRDDVLVSPGADDVRRRTRERLGIGPDQVAVLYAPTWRDDVATGYESAPGVTHLDPYATAARLGDGYVVLVRGHRFHAPAGVTGDGGVVDVTDHPDVNDLILASDVGVFDYSSIRFDFAVTGRPMVFLVPDLESYAGGGRGFLFPFEDSAPGPLLRDAREVVDVLRDPAALARAHASDLAAFNARFNPHHDGGASARVVDAFFGDRGLGG